MLGRSRWRSFSRYGDFRLGKDHSESYSEQSGVGLDKIQADSNPSLLEDQVSRPLYCFKVPAKEVIRSIWCTWGNLRDATNRENEGLGIGDCETMLL